jgi:hypothetical protein
MAGDGVKNIGASKRELRTLQMQADDLQDQLETTRSEQLRVTALVGQTRDEVLRREAADAASNEARRRYWEREIRQLTHDLTMERSLKSLALEKMSVLAAEAGAVQDQWEVESR